MTHFRLSARGHTVDGEQFVFTLHASANVLIASDVLPFWDDALFALWRGTPTTGDGIAQYYPASYGIDEEIVDELDPVTGKNVRQARAGTAYVGSGSDEPLPPQNAVVVSLRTALPTRAGRGRFYLPGPDVTTLDGGKLSAAVQDIFSQAAQHAVQALTSGSVTTEVYHRATKTGTAVTSVDVGNIFDTQRRRRDKLVEVRVSHDV